MQVNQKQCRHFRPRWWPLVFILPIAVATIVATAWWAPVALVFTIPVLAVVLAIGAFSNAGLILTAEGIEWYALHPRWRFRRVPWHAVLDVRRGLLGFGAMIYVVVKPARYERWLFGKAGRNPHIIEVWPRTLVDGDEVLDTLRDWFRRYGHEAGEEIASQPSA